MAQKSVIWWKKRELTVEIRSQLNKKMKEKKKLLPKRKRKILDRGTCMSAGQLRIVNITLTLLYIQDDQTVP